MQASSSVVLLVLLVNFGVDSNILLSFLSPFFFFLTLFSLPPSLSLLHVHALHRSFSQDTQTLEVQNEVF